MTHVQAAYYPGKQPTMKTTQWQRHTTSPSIYIDTPQALTTNPNRYIYNTGSCSNRCNRNVVSHISIHNHRFLHQSVIWMHISWKHSIGSLNFTIMTSMAYWQLKWAWERHCKRYSYCPIWEKAEASRVHSWSSFPKVLWGTGSRSLKDGVQSLRRRGWVSWRLSGTSSVKECLRRDTKTGEWKL